MILNFRHKGIKIFYETGNKAGIQAKHADRLRLILSRLNVATEPRDMNLPGLKLQNWKASMLVFRLWKLAAIGE